MELDALRQLLERQCGVLSRPQAVRAGVPETLIDNRLRSGRWQRLQQGVYATFTGQPGREAELWAALLRSGANAALSHRTAAELYGLTTEQSSFIHVTVPTTQRIAPISGVVLHHARAFYAIVHPTATPPRTSVEDTVLDLTASCKDYDDAFGWLCRAVGRGLTTPDRLRAALARRSRVRWRSDLLAALGDIDEGVRSPLEGWYVRNVERAHGLPAAERQVRIVTAGQVRYLDNLYREAMLAVELDGQMAHPPEQRWADSHRDNANAVAGILTVRYNSLDVTRYACRTATEVTGLISVRGMTVQPRRCRPGCPVTGTGGGVS